MKQRALPLLVAATAVVAVAGCAQVDPAATPVLPSNAATTTTPAADASATSASAAAPSPSSARPSPSRSASPTASPTPDPHEVLLQQGGSSAQVRELQARLRQLQLFSGYDVTDNFGPLTAKAVAAFQEAQGLTASGSVDRATWAALTRATAAPSDVELRNQNPGPVVVGADSGADALKDVQFRIAQVTGYHGGPSGSWSAELGQAVRDFQAQQVIPVTGEIDQRTFDRLAGVTRAAAPWEMSGGVAPTASDGVAQVLDPRCTTGRVICASMGQNKVSWVVDGTVLATMDARYGTPEFPTYPGVFQVYYKDANLISRLYGDVPMPFSLCFDQSRCVHYSEDFTYLGWSYGSHGCVNTRDYATQKWLYSQVRLGDTVVVY